MELVAIAANDFPLRVCSTEDVIKPRGPTSRKTRYPSSYIFKIVWRKRTGEIQLSAISLRINRALPEILFALAHEYTSSEGSFFIHPPANLRTAWASDEQMEVLNGLSKSSFKTLTPNSASDE